MSDMIFSGVSWMTAGVGIAALINFLFQIFMGNFLGTEDFTALVAMMGILSLFSLPLGVYESQTAAIISNNNTTGKIDYELNVNHFSPSSKFYFVLSIAAMISMFAVFPVDEISSRAPLIFCFVSSVCVLVMLRVRLGVFQGVKQFRSLAISTVTSSGAKFISGAILVSFGMGLVSGVFAIFFGMICSIFVLSCLKSDISGTQTDVRYMANNGFENRFGIATSLILVGIMLNWDVVVANFALSSEDAGLYSYSAVIAKCVIIASTAIIAVLVPSISESKTQQMRFSRFFKLVTIYALFSLPIVIIAYILQYPILSKIYLNSDPVVHQGPLFLIVLGYTFLSMAQFSVFSSIARLDVRGKIIRMTLTSTIPLFSIFFIDDVDSLVQILLLYSAVTFLILFSDEIVSIRRERIITD